MEKAMKIVDEMFDEQRKIYDTVVTPLIKKASNYGFKNYPNYNYLKNNNNYELIYKNKDIYYYKKKN